MNLQEILKTLPFEPGCYLYRDAKGVVIYVGKAKNLKKRVSSYFNKTHIDLHINNLVALVAEIEVVITDSELEAFILETNLIKKYKPYFNRDLKDDKSYIWIMMDKNEDFPRLQVVREKKRKNAIYLGPFHYTMPVRRILSRLRKIYPYRTCNRVIKLTKDPDTGKSILYSSDSRPCLYYQLGLCKAPCAGLTSKSDYTRSIKGITKFFTIGHKSMIEDLNRQMLIHSKNLEFEKASDLRDKINDLKYISQKVSIESSDTDEFKFIVGQKQNSINSLNQLINKIPELNLEYKKGFRIECYDISNIQGTNAVGSMIVFIDGKPSKEFYRKFKIRTKTTPDDFAMLKEIMNRRLNKLGDDKFGQKPDLIIIDGGKGQLSSIYKLLINKNINIPVIGLAKKMEEIFIINDNEGELNFLKRTLKYRSEAYFLIQRIRDESHRFAINYHRKLRSYDQTSSVLDDIPGVGNITKKRLLQAFGSVEGIKSASHKDLEQIIKNKNTLKAIQKLINGL